VTLTLDIFSRLVGAIVCASIALIVWDIGTRSPGTLLLDVRRALANPPALLRGTLRFLIGLVFIAVSVVLVFFSLPASEFSRYTLYQIGAFLTALVVELLIGEDVRPLLGLGRR
jgi:hypothetical protein